jgi:hypothetical protein
MKYFKTYEAYRRGVNGVGSLKNSLAALKRQNITGRYTDAETLAKGIRNEYEAITGEKYEDEVQMSMDDAIADIIGHFKLDGPEFMAAWDRVIKESVNEAKLKRGDKITIEFDDEDGDYKAGEYTVIGGSKGGKELEGMGIKIFMTDRELNSIEYTVNESYDGTLSDIKYDLEMALDNLGINSKALKGVKKTPKGYEVRMSSYMSDKNTWDRIGTDIGADLIDFKKGSINIGIYEKVNLKADHLSSAEYQKAKKLKDFNKDDWSWNSDTQLYDRVNEARNKKVTKQMWNKMSDEKRFDALLSVVKDPDDAEKFVDSKWEDLPSGFERDMILFEKRINLKQAADYEKKLKKAVPSVTKAKAANHRGEVKLFVNYTKFADRAKLKAAGQDLGLTYISDGRSTNRPYMDWKAGDKMVGGSGVLGITDNWMGFIKE